MAKCVKKPYRKATIPKAIREQVCYKLLEKYTKVNVIYLGVKI